MDSGLETVGAGLEARSRLMGQLVNKPAGLSWCQKHSDLADAVVKLCAEAAMEAQTSVPKLALFATGSYGRRELAPYSDLDLCLVPGQEESEELEATVRSLFRRLQDGLRSKLGLHVSYSYRSLGEMGGLDAKSRTALMDARMVWGSDDLSDALHRSLWQDFPTAEFLIEKIREREAAMARTHDTPLVMAPDLKEGAGGLRSFHTAGWIRAALGEQAPRLASSYDFVLMIRSLLHAVCGKAHETLNWDRRQQLASGLQLDPHELSSELCEAMSALEGEYRRAVERIQSARFFLSRNVVALAGEARISGAATASEAALSLSLADKLGLTVTDITTAVQPEITGSEALHALAAGEPTLRALDRCGVLDTLLPELTACRHLSPRDPGHIYSVFEHTLRAVRMLNSTPPGSFLSELKSRVTDPGLLTLAILMHDVGKADLTRPHSESGAEMCKAVALRWRLYGAQATLLEWLVREHLTMSKFIRLRDVMNAETAHEFAEVVGTLDRLDYLTLLTWADAKAVAPEAWGPVQDTFLEELYKRTVAVLASEVATAPDSRAIRSRMKRQLSRADFPEAEVDAFVDSLPAHYVFSTDSDSVRRHLRLAKLAAGGEAQVEIFDYPELNVSDLTVCADDRQGILSEILACLYALDITLVTIRASTTKESRPMIVDLFTISFGGRCIPRAQGQALLSAIRSVLSGRQTADELLRAHGKDPDRVQQIFRWSYQEGRPGILEVQAQRGRGMAYRMSKLIAKQGWNILAARLGQWAGTGAASFYLEMPGGGEVQSSDVRSALVKQKV